MPKSDNQKARLFAVYQILKRYTDETHGITVAEILDKLKKDYEIISTRQTIESDVALLNYPLNIPVDETFGKPKRYFLTDRTFNSNDVFTIATCIQYDCALTTNQKKELIAKLKLLCSEYEGKKLSLNTYGLKHQINLPSEKYRHEIETAIENEYKVVLKYNYYSFSGLKMNVTPKTYILVPLHEYFSNGQTYLCAYGMSLTRYRTDYHYEELLQQYEKKIYIFNVDQILSLVVKKYKPKSIPLPTVEEIQLAISNTPHSIYWGTTEKITMEIDTELKPFIIDRFGSALNIDKSTDKKLHIAQEVIITPEFFAWVLSLGTGAKLLSPLHVVQNMKYWIKSRAKVYGITTTSK